MMGLVNLREQEEKPKAIIMAGGAGVGKTFVTDKFKKAAKDKGWVVLNPDQYARNPDPEQRLSLAAAASKINKEVDSLAKSQDKPNIIWDTTANNPTKVKELQDAGYDVLMIMVYAHPSVAFEQNFARASKEGEDSLPPYVILKTWASSYNDPHIENYQKMFGDNFIIIDNTSKPGTDNSKIDAFNKAAQQGGKALEKHIGDIINSDPEYYSSTQMVSKPANLSKDQQDDFDSKVQQLGLKLEEDDREAMEKLYQKYFEKNNEAMPLKKVGRKNGMEEVYKSYMSKKVKKDAEKSKVYNDISASIKNIGKSFLSIDDATSKAMNHIGSKKINELTQFLVDSILNEETEKAVALFGGGFKPPTKGHLDVVNQGIKQNPEVSEVKILVGGGTRNGFTQDQAVKIWNLYNDVGFIKKPATIIPVSSPFTYYKNYLKDNPDNKVYVFIGSRPGEEKDQFDVKQRSEFVKKYSDNVIPVEVSTGGGVSGTMARELFKTDLDGFRNMFPENLLDQDFDKILDILNNKSTDSTPKPASNKTEPLTPKEENIDPKSQKKHKGKSAPFGSAYEPLNENATYSSKIDYKQQIKDLTKHMIKKGMNILPLPKVIFKHGDQENASQFLGKTAYYTPSDMTVVLYTEGRHPKDIVRSFAHEMIHHIQNLEDRLENISTTNTMEDDNLNDIEREAYTKGNMVFRNWTDNMDGTEVSSLNEIKKEVNSSIVAVLSRNGNQISLYDFDNKEPLGLINTYGNEVTGVAAKKGYGPLMYELGMANVYPNGLQSDRNGNTEPAAEEVLNKFIEGASSNIKVVKLTPKDKEYKTKYPNGNEVWNIDGFYNHKFYNDDTSTLKQLLQKGNELYPKEQNQIISDTEEMYDSMVNEEVTSLNEKIVGEKIECDNCGWSWNIVDGGDDLYICHKCDHDNEPENGDPFGLKAYARELVKEVFSKTVTINMDPIIKALEFEMPTGQETDENVISIIDAAPQGKVPHPVFLDFYAKFDKYFGEENDSRMLDNFGLEYLLSSVLNLPNEDIQTVINHYNTTDQDSVEWFEQHDNELKRDEEHNIPGFNDTNDDHESVVNYRRKQLAKSLEEQERVRIFNPNCGCDKT